MFVVAMEAFPPVTMPAMYGFYANRIYGLNVPVTEVFSLDEPARNAVLARQRDGIMWLPHCGDEKLSKLSLRWKRAVYVTDRIGTACLLEVDPVETRGKNP